MNQQPVDANRVIDNLATRIAQLERENAILTAQLQQADNGKETEDAQA